mgnify:CR=1 FL=1|tara:strand:+ start:24062 stop:24487 length:426 start_codon:yes stop_codon:yes gene_type:complete
MKKRLLQLCLLSSLSLNAISYAEESTLSEADQLREEIAQQKEVLRDLKEQLAAIENKQKPNTIAVGTDGSLHYLGKPIQSEELTEKLSDLPDNAKVVIRSNSQTPHQYIVSTMKICAEAGITDLTFQTFQKPTPESDNPKD